MTPTVRPPAPTPTDDDKQYIYFYDANGNVGQLLDWIDAAVAPPSATWSASRIRVFYLPSYSRELNPDEYLNQDGKTNEVGRQLPHNADEPLGTVSGYLAAARRYPPLVKRYFRHPQVTPPDPLDADTMQFVSCST